MSTLPFAIDRIRRSIVQMRVHSDDGTRPVLGTGFLVHPQGLVLTAGHVVASSASGRLVAGLSLPNVNAGGIVVKASFELRDLELLEVDPRHDLSVLRLVDNPFLGNRPSGISKTDEGGMAINAMFGLAPLRAEQPRDGEPIAVSGYPLSEPSLITTAGIIASAWGTEIRNVQPEGAPEGFTLPDIADSYIADVAVNPGNSGGPVYLALTGDVIGVCVAFRIAEVAGAALRYNSGLSIVVPIQYGIQLLQRHVTS